MPFSNSLTRLLKVQTYISKSVIMTNSSFNYLKGKGLPTLKSKPWAQCSTFYLHNLTLLLVLALPSGEQRLSPGTDPILSVLLLKHLINLSSSHPKLHLMQISTEQPQVQMLPYLLVAHTLLLC